VNIVYGRRTAQERVTGGERREWPVQVRHLGTSALPAARCCTARPSPSAPPCFDSDRANFASDACVGGLNILTVG
jgi:hypothetical protein